MSWSCMHRGAIRGKHVHVCNSFVCPPCLLSRSIPPCVTSQCVTSPEPRADQHSKQHSSLPPHTQTHTHTYVLEVNEHAHSTTPCLHDDAITNTKRQYNTNSPMCTVMTDWSKMYGRTYEELIITVDVSSSDSSLYDLVNT